MAGPRSPFPIRYLDEAIGFLVPRSGRSSPRSFVPVLRPLVPRSGPWSLRSLFTDLSHNHPPREDMNVNVLMFEDIIEEEVENLYKKICIYKSSGINTISSRIWKTVYHNFPVFFLLSSTTK